MSETIAKLLTAGVLVICLAVSRNKASVDSIINNSTSLYDSIDSVDISLDIEANGTLGSLMGDSDDLSYNIDLDIKSENSKGSFISGTVAVDSYEKCINSYISDRDNTIYSYFSSVGVWSKEVSSEDIPSASEFVSKLHSLDYSSIYNKLSTGKVLRLNKDKLNGVEVYYVSGILTGSDLKEIFSTDSYSLGDVSMNTTLYFSTEDYRLLEVKLDLRGTDFTSLFNDYLMEGFGVDFDTFIINITFNSFNDYTFKIPEDITDRAIDKKELTDSPYWN